MRVEVVPGCGACGRRRGLAGLRDRSLRAKLVCGDLAGGPPPTGATGRIKWAGCGGMEGGARPAGPGRASRSITPSEARVWRSRGRAAAHRRNRSDQVGRPRAARKRGGEDVARKRGGVAVARKRGGEGAARKRGRQEFSVRGRRSRRGRLRNRSRMGRCGPGGSRGRSRRLRRLRRCQGRGRG